jgi:hypothetical protein
MTAAETTKARQLRRAFFCFSPNFHISQFFISSDIHLPQFAKAPTAGSGKK